MASLKFYIRPSSKSLTAAIRIRYSISRDNIMYCTTPLVVTTSLWDEKKEKVKLRVLSRTESKLPVEDHNALIGKVNEINKEREQFNSKLDDLKTIITDRFNKGGEVSGNWLLNIVNEFFNPKEEKILSLNEFIPYYIEKLESGEIQKKRGGKVSLGTIKSYKGFYVQFQNFQKDKHIDINYSDVTIDILNRFRAYLSEDRAYSTNTVGRMVKIFKTMMLASRKRKFHDNRNIDDSDFVASYEQVDNVYLSEERINILYSMDLSNRPAWEKVRDVFIVGCLTGQRVSDYKRISKKMIVTLNNGLEYIKLKQIKTGTIVFIPLDYRVSDILNKYDGRLPNVYDQKINDYIKLVCEEAGFTERIFEQRFCDQVKTHTARRSLCTNMYLARCSLSDIMAVSGHGSEAQLKTYLKLSDEEKAIKADNGYVKRKG